MSREQLTTASRAIVAGSTALAASEACGSAVEGRPVADEPVTPPPTSLVNLAKITLDNPGQKVSLKKKGASFGTSS